MNPDQGLRVVAPHIGLSESHGVGAVTFAVFARAGLGGFLGFGDGAIGWVAAGEPAEALKTVARIGATPIDGVADVDGASVIIGTDDGRLLRVEASGQVTPLAEDAEAWIEKLAVHPGTLRRAYTVGRRVVVLDAKGECVAELDGHPSTVAGLAFSKKGDALAAAHYGGVTVHHLDKPGQAPDLLEWHGSHTAVTWSPDNRFIVTAMQENEMHCWRWPEKKGMRMSGYPSKIRALSWTADGQYLAASGADTVTSWSFAGKGPSGKAPTEFGYVFNENVCQVAVHPSAPTVAGGYSDGTVLIGSIEKESASIARPGNGAKVTALGWSPDGGALIVGTEAGEVALCKVGSVLS